VIVHLTDACLCVYFSPKSALAYGAVHFLPEHTVSQNSTHSMVQDGSGCWPVICP
jgi:hypothetical protein